VSKAPSYGLFSFGFFQGDLERSINYIPSSFGSIIATTGGQASGLIGIFAIVIGSYQGFAYDKSSIKRFYREDSLEAFEMNTFDDDDDDGSGTRPAMRKQMLRTSQFSMNYCTYMLLSLLSSFCCCLTKCLQKDGWYSRNMQRYKRIEIAK